MKHLLLSVFLFVGLRAWAQPAAWTFALPATDINALMDVATDGSGNTYVTGRFTGSTQLGTTTLTSSRPGVCLYIAKISPAGRVLRVTKLEGATDVTIYAITADAAGNTFITGSFIGTLTYNGGQQTTGRLPLPGQLGGYNVLLVKCGTNGRVHWVQQADGGAAGIYGNSYGADVAVDQAGNSYICGRINGSGQFGPILLEPRKNQGFLASYTPQGQVRWARVLQAFPLQAAVSAGSAGAGVAVDRTGHCYMTGIGFIGWQLDGITVTNLSGNPYLAQFDARTGHLEWAQRVPGEGDGRALATDRQGDVYLGGSFTGTAVFGPCTLTSAGDADGFVARYDPDGSLDWATALGGPNYDVVSSLAVDQKSRKTFVTGMMNFTSQGTNQSFLASITSNSQTQYLTQVGGPGTSSGGRIAIDGDNNIYTTGVFTGNCHFGAIGLSCTSTQSYFGRYGSRAGSHGNGRDDDEDDVAAHPTPALYPNPAQSQFMLHLPGQAGSATLYSPQGRPVATHALQPNAATGLRFDTSALPDGLYLLQLDANGHRTTQLVKVQH